MSYQILLVDDESVDLEWLRRRIAADITTASIAASVNSAFTALKLLEERPIDILMTDIRMPVMSGLGLADKARQLNPQIKIVFISGHEDFDYAKQAIDLKASAYLLKPVSDQQLQDTLQHLTQQLDHERHIEKLSQRWTKTLPLIESKLLIGWMEGSATEQMNSMAEHVVESIGENWPLTTALIEIDDLEWKMAHLTEEERRELAHSLFNMIEELCSIHQVGQYLRNGSYAAVLLAACNRDHLISFSETLVESIAARFPATITVSVGHQAYELQALRQSYKEAQQCLHDKWFAGKNRVIVQPLPKATGNQTPIQLDELSKVIFEAMLQYQLVHIDEQLTLLFKHMEKYEHKKSNAHLVLQFISSLHTHCQQIEEDLYELLHWQDVHLNMLFQFETVHDMHSWLRRRLFECSELIYIKKNSQKRKIIHRIDEYVHDKLQNKITLKEVADYLEFSPNYLGQLFKEETGEHFSNYLIKLRMNKACELLKDPKYKVYEIAEQAGYKNILYFNRQFKQMTGCTPGQYRKLHKV